MAEKEYIEREALLKKFYTDTRFGFYGDFTDGSETAYTSAEVNAIIENVPAADVVEVVRCKNCLFYEKIDYYHPTDKNAVKSVCKLFKRQMQPDDFCSYGKRKDEQL